MNYSYKMKNTGLMFVFILFVSHTIRGQCFYTGTCYTIYDKGVSYRGNVAITKSGQHCVPWNHHLHTFTSDRFRYDGLDANYCRNPLGKRDAPWCYNTPTGKEDESWEYCEIEMCDKCLFRGVLLKTGDRFHDGCSMCICQASGIRCLEEIVIVDRNCDKLKKHCVINKQKRRSTQGSSCIR